MVYRAWFIDCADFPFFFSTAQAEPYFCLPPEQPYLPQTQDEADSYGEIVAGDAEQYFRATETYLECLEQERRRATEDTRNFIDAYADYLTSFRK